MNLQPRCQAKHPGMKSQCVLDDGHDGNHTTVPPSVSETATDDGNPHHEYCNTRDLFIPGKPCNCAGRVYAPVPPPSPPADPPALIEEAREHAATLQGMAHHATVYGVSAYLIRRLADALEAAERERQMLVTVHGWAEQRLVVAESRISILQQEKAELSAPLQCADPSCGCIELRCGMCGEERLIRGEPVHD